MSREIKLIMLGTSSGGVRAVQVFLKALDDEIEAPIIIIQHIPDYSRTDPNKVYGNYTKRTLIEAMDKMPIENNHVYFAPPSYHLSVESELYFALSQEDKVNFSRPSIDVAFESGRRAFVEELCVILLTGANDDGARAMSELAKSGVYTIVQDPESAEVDRMPTAALKLFSPNYVGDIEEIANHLHALVLGSE